MMSSSFSYLVHCSFSLFALLYRNWKSWLWNLEMSSSSSYLREMHSYLKHYLSSGILLILRVIFSIMFKGMFFMNLLRGHFSQLFSILFNQGIRLSFPPYLLGLSSPLARGLKFLFGFG